METPLKTFAAWATLVGVMVVLDVIWLGFVAKPLYQQGIGHLMSEQPRLGAAVAFYLVYAAGVMFFVVLPQASAAGWVRTLATGAFFGFLAYATYDLSNLATLKGWPLSLAVIDMAWGTVITGVAALAARAVWLRVPG